MRTLAEAGSQPLKANLSLILSSTLPANSFTSSGERLQLSMQTPSAHPVPSAPNSPTLKTLQVEYGMLAAAAKLGPSGGVSERSAQKATHFLETKVKKGRKQTTRRCSALSKHFTGAVYTRGSCPAPHSEEGTQRATLSWIRAILYEKQKTTRFFSLEKITPKLQKNPAHSFNRSLAS